MFITQVMKQLLQTIIFTVALIPMFGCSEAVDIDDGPDEVLIFEAIGLGQNGSVRDTVHVVLNDQAELDAMLQQVEPLEPLPEVDFSQYMVGLVAVPTESGGYTVEIKSVERTGDEITVHYILNVPGTDCITLQALALPHQYVMIARSQGNVTFVEERDRYLCGM